MTPLVDFSSESLLSYVDDIGRLPQWFVSRRRSVRVGNIVAYDLSIDSFALTQLSMIATDDLPRILDRFHLWTPRDFPETRQLLLDSLFEVAAADYSHIICPAQNRENIRNLMTAIDLYYGAPGRLRVLDFGCGSGLSSSLNLEYKLFLSGYDRCPKMREAAMTAGLSVITPDEFATLPKHTYDAIFASYVFHLCPSRVDLRYLWSLLRPNGIIVANFHKNHGVTEATEIYSELGGNRGNIKPAFCRFMHGTYWAYLRAG